MISSIVDIDLDRMLVIKSSGLPVFDDNYTHLEFNYFLSSEIFMEYIQKLRANIRNRKNIEDRWEPWECRIDGIFSAKKHSKVIETRRKTGEIRFNDDSEISPQF